MKIKLYDKKCKPSYTNPIDACMDCRARTDVEWINEDGVWRCNVPLGFAIECPEDYGIFLFSRSGMGRKQNITLINSVGIGDRSFGNNEYQAMLVSFSFSKPKPIKQYQRIVQMAIIRVPKIFLEVVDDFNIGTKKDGFGSSGIK